MPDVILAGGSEMAMECAACTPPTWVILGIMLGMAVLFIVAVVAITVAQKERRRADVWENRARRALGQAAERSQE